jgi:hypothetical protein
MHEFAWTYWWLIFPVMWGVFGIFGMMMASQRERARLELMKTYAEKGKDPSEISRALGPGPDYWDYRWARRAWRYSPYWAWPRAIMAVCVAAGFWVAAYYTDWPFWGWPGLRLVAVIMTVIAAAALMRAIFASLFAPKLPEH